MSIDTDAIIAVCNQSLGLLGAEPIVNGGSSQNHTYCETFYDQARDEILAGHRWNFAGKRAFAIQTTNPLFGYDYAYTKPSDCLKVWKIADDQSAEFVVEGSLILTDEGESPTDYDEDGVEYLAGEYISSDISGSDLTYKVDTAFTSSDETTDIAANCTSQGGDLKILKVEYVYQVTDIANYPPYLKQCVIYNLAIKLCSPIKQDEKVALNLQSMLFGGPRINGYLSQARSFDAQESGGMKITTNTWLNARN